MEARKGSKRRESVCVSATKRFQHKPLIHLPKAVWCTTHPCLFFTVSQQLKLFDILGNAHYICTHYEARTSCRLAYVNITMSGGKKLANIECLNTLINTDYAVCLMKTKLTSFELKLHVSPDSWQESECAKCQTIPVLEPNSIYGMK